MNVNFDILEILQSCIRIRIDIQKSENIVVIKEQDQKKIFIINNVSTKNKAKQNKSDINISNHLRMVTFKF